MKHLRNGISVKSNTKRSAEFTNCNLSQRLFELTLLFFNDVDEHQFPLTVPRPLTPHSVGSVLWRLPSTLEVVHYIGGIISVLWGEASVLWGIASVLWSLLSTVGDSFSTVGG